MRIVRRNAGLGQDPTNIRDVEVPVGLKVRLSVSHFDYSCQADLLLIKQNLGATCYANSFLQVSSG